MRFLLALNGSGCHAVARFNGPAAEHSGRVGLASELTTRGASTTDVMRAGNWKTSRMVAHYSAGATAERGAWWRAICEVTPPPQRQRSAS